MCPLADTTAGTPTMTTGGGVLIPPSAKRLSLDGESRLTNRPPTARSPGSRSHIERGSREADSSSTKSPTVTAYPFLVVTKAGIVFCFYRRLYQLKIRIPDEVIKLFIDSGNAAVEAAEQQANQGCLFWNVIGSVFQYACVHLCRSVARGTVGSHIVNALLKTGRHTVTAISRKDSDNELPEGVPVAPVDFDKRYLTIYDDGNTKNSLRRYRRLGDENDKSLTLSTFLNKGVYIKSFLINQNCMFESVKRVTGTTDADWTITHEDTKKRHENGLAQVKLGNMAGCSKLLYARAFYPDDSSDISEKAWNDLLGLPEENLDESTKVGIDLAKELQLRVEHMAS
ncbi:hypothetical protein N7495_008961 [Penicillium taxi]|uniref:uncharacterized protein n=1 Tax=Penicillium taxi TaxID=168475 RepID=UPI0025454D60|nr:uncharacterized protein N7495_008961 [Penicillium taxi]KAJ5888920.1 hypothetical protein N7495_008961 [Penicillium taxi]